MLLDLNVKRDKNQIEKQRTITNLMVSKEYIQYLSKKTTPKAKTKRLMIRSRG